ncbi:winged helix-turn-helix transcriptional regulator [Salinigranum halophilum]|uniref:winged helix-turn-helix transcriptional regulator n=1 Tax=Salinigranum halophilum TaxID=2565931 RepID=UPI00115DCD3A|nr:helix-turn-helix domain-containing protein [Salinigranum halophilum]
MTTCSRSRCVCPDGDLMDVLASRYTMQLVCIVDAHGTVRFSELESHLPDASTSTLSTRLTRLVEAGILDRQKYDEVPPRVEYELTRDGRGLARRTRSLLSWVDRHD